MNKEVEQAIEYIYDDKYDMSSTKFKSVKQALNIIKQAFSDMEKKIEDDRLTILYTKELQNRVYEQKQILDKIIELTNKRTGKNGYCGNPIQVYEIKQILGDE